jgi:hypothetical protein
MASMPGFLCFLSVMKAEQTVTLPIQGFMFVLSKFPPF